MKRLFPADIRFRLIVQTGHNISLIVHPLSSPGFEYGRIELQ